MLTTVRLQMNVISSAILLGCKITEIGMFDDDEYYYLLVGFVLRVFLVVSKRKGVHVYRHQKN